MKRALLLPAALVAAHLAHAQSEVATPATSASAPAAASAPEGPSAMGLPRAGADPNWLSMCLFGGKPPADSKYHVVGKVKLAKQTYGTARELVPKLVNQARAAGGDAMMDYSGAQRFGFWPWRLTRPVVSGTAIKWDEAPTKECREMGGVTAGLLVQTNESPAR